jgi:VWFA-related protein
MLQRSFEVKGLRSHSPAIFIYIHRVACAALLISWFSIIPSADALAEPLPGSPPQAAAAQTSSAPTLQRSKEAPATSVSVQVNVVNVLATVRDKKGNIVNDLTKDDFVLTEDGRTQEIHYFTKETDLPLTLGLLVDTSLSQRQVLDQERAASETFLDNMVREDKDKAFVIHFDREVELLQDLTASRKKLEDALALLQTPAPQFTQTTSTNSPDSDPNQGTGGRGSGRGSHSGGTLLYDAVYLASNELMQKQTGRKALIILSDGVDRGSKETLTEAIETAQRADTIVYSILFKGEQGSDSGTSRGGFGIPGMGMPGGGMGRRGGRGYPSPEENHPDGKKILEQISKTTGGRLFEVSKKLPVGDIYAQIEQELRSQYNLGYTPARAEGTSAAGYHKIELTAKKKDMTVQAREGYFGNPAQ